MVAAENLRVKVGGKCQTVQQFPWAIQKCLERSSHQWDNRKLNELFTKQACRDAVEVYSLFFCPTTYTSLYSYVLSTVLRISNFTLYIYT